MTYIYGKLSKIIIIIFEWPCGTCHLMPPRGMKSLTSCTPWGHRESETELPNTYTHSINVIFELIRSFKMSQFKDIVEVQALKNYDIKCKEMQPDRFLPGKVFIFLLYSSNRCLPDIYVSLSFKSVLHSKRGRRLSESPRKPFQISASPPPLLQSFPWDSA